jgi:hypothetical protein
MDKIDACPFHVNSPARRDFQFHPEEVEMRFNKFLFILVALLLAFTVVQPGIAQGRGPAPILGADSLTAIPDQYIIVFDNNAGKNDRDNALGFARGQGAEIQYEYESALKGFAATLPAQALQGLQNNPHVLYIEAVQTVSIDVNQTPATWGLDRIDQRTLPLNNIYTYNYTGTGVTAMMPSVTARTALTATVTARTSPVPLAAQPTALPKA